MLYVRFVLLASLLLLGIVILNGCATMTATVVTDPTTVACEAFPPISWSTADTDETILEVKNHNAAWAAICEGAEADVGNTTPR